MIGRFVPTSTGLALAFVLVPLLLVSTGSRGVGQEAEAPSGERRSSNLDELGRLYAARDYFGLRERLGEPEPDEPPELVVLRAGVAHAFNEPARSNTLLRRVLSAARSLPDSLLYEARRISFRNSMRLHRYREATETLEELLSDLPTFVDSTRVRDFRNMRRFSNALRDVEPQHIIRRADTRLELVGRGHVPVTVDGSARDYPLDTGANLSVLIRSEAEALGLEVREAGVEVGTSTDLRVTADVAIADRLEVGHLELRNVAFLVVPDEVLTFPGLVIRGVLGFPIAEALGELRFADGAIEVPGEVPAREVRNLALHQLTPLIRVGYEGSDLICRFDTGANRTAFYEPFFERYEARIRGMGTPDTLRTGGAGGVRDLPGYRLEKATLRVAGESVSLTDVHVHTRVLEASEEDNVLHCNLGQDVLTRFDGYVLNFRSMSLFLR